MAPSFGKSSVLSKTKLAKKKNPAAAKACVRYHLKKEKYFGVAVEFFYKFRVQKKYLMFVAFRHVCCVTLNF
jgi:hypothetical protein